MKKPARPLARKRTGRPSLFTQALGRKICDRIAKGDPLTRICKDAGMPSVKSVNNWVTANEAFAKNYALARVLGFDAIAAECLEIADTPLIGHVVREAPDGRTITTEDMLGHRKLQIETRLKLLSKWDPKRYGDKLDLQHSGNVEIVMSIGGDDAE